MCVEEEEEEEAEEDIPGSRKSQKHKLNLKLKVLKLSAFFLRFSIARIRPKFEEKISRFLYMVQVGSQKTNRRKCLKNTFLFIL
jgi:hypothetical protein